MPEHSDNLGQVPKPTILHSVLALKVMLRKVTLRRVDDAPFLSQPYADALISDELLDPEFLAPVQRYVLEPELRKLEEVRWRFFEQCEWDIFDLQGYIETNECDILPPIVEEHVGTNGRIYPLIADGQHRVYLAMQYGMKIRVMYIRGVRQPYYAYPLTDGWLDVSVISKLEPGYIKKFHVRRNYKALFRDFNSVFNNVSESRPYAESETTKVLRGLNVFYP